jgi:hypothetical protein
MSRPMVGISTTYKTRVALEVIVRNGRNRYWTVIGEAKPVVTTPSAKKRFRAPLP